MSKWAVSERDRCDSRFKCYVFLSLTSYLAIPRPPPAKIFIFIHDIPLMAKLNEYNKEKKNKIKCFKLFDFLTFEPKLEQLLNQFNFTTRFSSSIEFILMKNI